MLIINMMGESLYHWKLAIENRDGARSEFEAKRYSNVGILSIRSLEQAIEACAAKKNLHFHEDPRRAHRMRRNWLRSNFPNLSEAWEILWSIYGELGYGGADGTRAKLALKTLEATLEVLRRECIESDS